MGHNVFRYPLMGRRAQHQLTYISPHAEPTGPTRAPIPLDETAWRQRILSSGIDYLFLQGTRLPEWTWAQRNPEFDLAWSSSTGLALYRVVHER